MVFKCLDTNGSGGIDLAEWERLVGGGKGGNTYVKDNSTLLHFMGAERRSSRIRAATQTELASLGITGNSSIGVVRRHPNQSPSQSPPDPGLFSPHSSTAAGADVASSEQASGTSPHVKNGPSPVQPSHATTPVHAPSLRAHASPAAVKELNGPSPTMLHCVKGSTVQRRVRFI